MWKWNHFGCPSTISYVQSTYPIRVPLTIQRHPRKKLKLDGLKVISGYCFLIIYFVIKVLWPTLVDFISYDNWRKSQYTHFQKCSQLLESWFTPNSIQFLKTTYPVHLGPPNRVWNSGVLTCWVFFQFLVSLELLRLKNGHFFKYQLLGDFDTNHLEQLDDGTRG